MRKTNEQDVTIQETVVEDILCDKCGESILLEDFGECFAGGLAVFDFGYGSNNDGLLCKVEMCDKCCDEFLSSLKYEPEKL